MKSRTLMFVTAITLFAALAIPVRLAGQEQNQKPPHSVADLGTRGTFGEAKALPNNTIKTIGFWAGHVVFRQDMAVFGQLEFLAIQLWHLARHEKDAHGSPL